MQRPTAAPIAMNIHHLPQNGANVFPNLFVHGPDLEVVCLYPKRGGFHIGVKKALILPNSLEQNYRTPKVLWLLMEYTVTCSAIFELKHEANFTKLGDVHG